MARVRQKVGGPTESTSGNEGQRNEEVPKPDGNKSGSGSDISTDPEEKTRGKKTKPDKPKAAAKGKGKRAASWSEFLAKRKPAVKNKYSLRSKGALVDGVPATNAVHRRIKRKRKDEDTDDSQGSETDPEKVCKKNNKEPNKDDNDDGTDDDNGAAGGAHTNVPSLVTEISAGN